MSVDHLTHLDLHVIICHSFFRVLMVKFLSVLMCRVMLAGLFTDTLAERHGVSWAMGPGAEW